MSIEFSSMLFHASDEVKPKLRVANIHLPRWKRSWVECSFLMEAILKGYSLVQWRNWWNDDKKWYVREHDVLWCKLRYWRNLTKPRVLFVALTLQWAIWYYIGRRRQKGLKWRQQKRVFYALNTDVRKTIQFSRNLTQIFNSYGRMQGRCVWCCVSPVQLNFLKANKPHIDRLNEHDNFINNVSRQATEKIVRSQDSAVSAKTIKTNWGNREGWRWRCRGTI